MSNNEFEIKDGVLLYYNGYDTDVRIPDGVREIDAEFVLCNNIESVYIPDGVTTICCGAFRDCVYLRSVRLPDTLKCIEYEAFTRCAQLSDITIPESVEHIGADAFTDTKWLDDHSDDEYIMANSHLLYMYNGTKKHIELPDYITEIGGGAFSDNWNVLSFKAKNLKRICGQAFSGCASLTTAELNDGIEEIGVAAFTDCSSLKEISIPSGVECLQKLVFSGCNSLERLELHNGVRHICNSAFENCNSLREVDIPDSVESIDYNAFYKCSSLARVSVPESTRIDSTVFSGTEWLTNNKERVVILNGRLLQYRDTQRMHYDIPEDVYAIDAAAFRWSFLNSVRVHGGIEEIEFETFREGYDLERVELCEGVKEIGALAFAHNGKLREVILPNTLRTIGNYAFCDCKMLRSIELPEGLKEINFNAFERSGLIEVTIPGSVEFIGAWAFADCEDLSSITLCNGVREIKADAFSGCNKLKSIIIPESVVDIDSRAFKNCTNLSDIVILGKRDAEHCRQLVDSNWFYGAAFPDVKLYVEGVVPDDFTNTFYCKYAFYGYASACAKGFADRSVHQAYLDYYKENLVELTVCQFYKDFKDDEYIVKFLIDEGLMTVFIAEHLLKETENMSVRARLLQYLNESGVTGYDSYDI